MIEKILLYNTNNFGLFDKRYEEYLLCLINNSKYLTNKYGIFLKPISESHGEDDANSPIYSIDFKRFITQDECKYRRSHNTDTIDIISINDNKILSNGYYDMIKCMKKLYKKDFYNIRDNMFDYIDGQEEREYKNIVNRLLMKDKNIMLFLPKIVITQHYTLDELLEFFSYILKDMFEFRKENVEKDLYFTFITLDDINELGNAKFIIGQYTTKLELIDIVSTDKCKIFN
jgi:hypothetical protein